MPVGQSFRKACYTKTKWNKGVRVVAQKKMQINGVKEYLNKFVHNE